MTIRIHQLEGFYWTGLEGGYTKAAEAMPYPITEPAIYQQVRKLERTLGVSLVRQAKPRRTVLTPEGRALHDFIAPFFQQLPGVVEGLKRRDAARIALAIDGAIGFELVGPALAVLRAKRPNVEVRLQDVDSNAVLRAVETGGADMGLGVLLGGSSEVRTEPLLVVRVALCVPSGHALAERKTIARADMDDVPICVYDRSHPGRAIIERAYRDAGIRLRVAAEATNVDTLRLLVAAGVAPAFVPVAAPFKKPRRAAAPGRFVVHDVTGLVPGEPVRYGLVHKTGVSKHPALLELEGLIKATRLEAAAL
jgi:DNA-binding transcriptional LysR family regulator